MQPSPTQRFSRKFCELSPTAGFDAVLHDIFLGITVSSSCRGSTLSVTATSYGYTGTVPQELVDFARRQLVNATLYRGDERRREERHPMMVPVLAVGVDENNQPLGEPFEAITRDVAATSIGLFHAEPILHDRLAIHMTLANTDVDLVIALKWKRPMGPFYGSAGVYMDKLDRFPIKI
jgi:hypothetical protein